MQINSPELFRAAGELAKDPFLSAPFGKKAFVGQVPPKKDVEAFLRQCGLYDRTSKRWIYMPKTPLRDVEVQVPVLQIFKAVLGYFNYTATRDVFGISRPSAVPGQSATPWVLLPDILPIITGITDSSPSVVNPTKLTDNNLKFLYPRCASSTLTIARRNTNEAKDIRQLALFATLCFRMQCNRTAVYSLKITEQDVVLYLFDHSGVLYSSGINIHDNPTDFIRLILGIVSPDDSLIGFDKNVFWKGQQRFIRTADAVGNSVCYPLTHSEPVYKHKSMRGISTICWKAMDPTNGMEIVVKDIWVPDNGNAEIRLLEASKGLLGVGQIVSYEIGTRVSAKKLIDNRQKSRFSDLIFNRIILQNSGKSIAEFESPEEVLYALRDAIEGHQNLWNCGIAHRDISVGNILIGRPGNPIGNRGVLIDLSHAAWRDPTKNSERFVRGGVGTRIFLSVNSLESFCSGRRSTPYSYLDDLESFFYVFCWIIFCYISPGTLVNPAPSLLINWGNTVNILAQATKKAMYYDRIAPAPISDFFGPAFQKLFNNLLEFFDAKIGARKRNSLLGLSVQVNQPANDAQGDYHRVLALFDEAIAELARSKGTPEEAEVAGPSDPTSSGAATAPVEISDTAHLGRITRSKSVQAAGKRPRENDSVNGGGSNPKKRKE